MILIVSIDPVGGSKQDMTLCSNFFWKLLFYMIDKWKGAQFRSKQNELTETRDVASILEGPRKCSRFSISFDYSHISCQ